VETDRQTDGRTDGGDCITSLVNAVRNKINAKTLAPTENMLQENGREYANYFRIRMRDVVKLHRHVTRRDWLQQLNIMLITLQDFANFVNLQVFATL